MRDVFGRDCRLGYGIDPLLNYIVPFECTPINVREEQSIQKALYIWNLSDREHFMWCYIGQYLSDSFLKLLKHQVVFNQTQHFLVTLHVETKSKKCDGCDKYPDNVPDYVAEIKYGVDVYIIIDKEKFPNTEKEAHKFFTAVFQKETTLSKTQKKLNCRVLINCEETREMTLGQAFQFVDEFNRGQHRVYECPIEVNSKSIRKMSPIISTAELASFLKNLYACYQKMEIVLEKEGFPIFKIDEPASDSFNVISANLENAITKLRELEEPLYRLLGEKMPNVPPLIGFIRWLIPPHEINLVDFVYLYSVLEELFRCFQTYIRHAIEHRIKIPEKYFLKYEQLYLLFETLDGWTPELGTEYLVVSKDCKNVERTVKQTKKWKNLSVIRNDSTNDPFIFSKVAGKTLIGFVNMQGAVKPNKLETKSDFENKCPRSCTDDLRKWICTDCGEYVQLGTVGGLKMICDCGFKEYDRDLLTCVHPLHLESMKIDALPEGLKLIVKQLKKHQNRYDPDSDKKIKEAVQKLINNDLNPHQMGILLSQFRDLTVTEVLTDKNTQIQKHLDGDTLKLIDKYLK